MWKKNFTLMFCFLLLGCQSPPYLIHTRLDIMYRNPADPGKIIAHRHRGLLLACGIVAGASIMGVILAIPFAFTQSSNALKLMPDQFAYLTGGLSIIVTLFLCVWIYRFVLRRSET